jgi:hypothetical protein
VKRLGSPARCQVKKVVIEALRQGRLELIVSLDLSMEPNGIKPATSWLQTGRSNSMQDLLE